MSYSLSTINKNTINLWKNNKDKLTITYDQILDDRIS